MLLLLLLLLAFPCDDTEAYYERAANRQISAEWPSSLSLSTLSTTMIFAAVETISENR